MTITADTAKRTRVLKQPQSRNGCYTCKNRRVRCDRARPVCLHCSKADRQCDFPPGTDSPSPPSTALATLVIADSQRSSKDILEVSRLVKLTSESVHFGSLHRGGATESFWSSTLPQLTHTYPIVSASAAALGAAIELKRGPLDGGRSRMLRWYINALQKIRAALDASLSTPTALATSCVLLSLAECLIGQGLPALSHLQGALGVLVQRQNAKASLPGADKGNKLTPTDDSAFYLEDEVDIAGAILDISTASYALGLEPRLPRVAIRTGLRDSTMRSPTADLLENRILVALHTSFGFAAKYNTWRYVPERLRPTHMLFDQGRLTEQLFRLNQELQETSQTAAKMKPARACSLRAQCIACMIYVACLFQPRESSYDRFHPSFDEITRCADSFYRSRERGLSGRSFGISLDIGVIQPLFFTAIKCRNRKVRHRAVHLLEQEGREGPFDAGQHAAVARRALEWEDRSAESSPRPLDASGSQILEAIRLHSAGVDLSTDAAPGHVSAGFSRCRDVEGMMLEETTDGYQDPRWWDIWNEEVCCVT